MFLQGDDVLVVEFIVDIYCRLIRVALPLSRPIFMLYYPIFDSEMMRQCLHLLLLMLEVKNRDELRLREFFVRID